MASSNRRNREGRFIGDRAEARWGSGGAIAGGGDCGGDGGSAMWDGGGGALDHERHCPERGGAAVFENWRVPPCGRSLCVPCVRSRVALGVTTVLCAVCVT
jgi:hypothetical protein